MKTYLRNIGVLLFFSMVFWGCGSSDPIPSASCNTVGTPFQQLAANLMSSTMPMGLMFRWI